MEYPTASRAGEEPQSEPKSDLTADYRALSAGVGYRVAEDRLVVRITGEDRVPFLNGMCSNDIRRLEPGSLIAALLLTEHAHVVTDFYVWARNDALILETDRAMWPSARAQLEKFLVADDVEIEELASMAVVDIEGPQAQAAVAALAPDAGALAPWHHVVSERIGIANLPRFGRPAFTVLAEDAGSFVDELNRAAASIGIREVSAEAIEVLRIESGTPRIGVDTGTKTIALEARLQSAISFDKGCYVGQETVERATSRGGVKKKLLGLRVRGARVPGTNAAVMLEGKEVGRVTSVADSPRIGVIGLSILHHSAWTVGTEVVIADAQGELGASVSDLPFQ